LAAGLVMIADVSHAQVASGGRQVEAEGELQIRIEDNFRAHTSRTRHFLMTPASQGASSGGQIELSFRGKPPQLRSGTRVRVKGTETGGLLVLDSGGTTGSIQVVQPALTSTFGEQATLVLLVNFQDQSSNQPWTAAQVSSAVFGTASNYLLEASYQQMSLSGDVHGWYTIPVSSTSCDSSQIATASLNAATAAGVDVSAYSRRVYVFPNNSNCAWSGQGTIGGSPSDSWVNGTLDGGIIAHEIGHNLGLYHSHGLECGTAVVGGTCSTLEYGDTLDTMGGGQGHFSAFQKENLGWLNHGVSPPITTVTANGTYPVSPYETADANPKALKILQQTEPTTGLNTWYYVEYRQPLGFDAFISPTTFPLSNIPNGVVIHVATQSSFSSNDLLDMTPSSSSLWDWNDVALGVGQSWSDANSGVTLTTAWANSTNAGVTVALAQPGCMRANPVVSMSPASQSGAAGSALTYTLAVTNKDGSSCSASSFALNATLPSGWSSSFASPTLSLAPGASASTSLQVSSPVGAPSSMYMVGATATNSAATGYISSTSASYQVVAGPTVAVTTNQTSYNNGQTVTSRATVTSGGVALSGANVSFVVTESNGTTAKGSAITGANGAASYSLKLSRKAPPGMYTVQARATSNGLSGSGTTSFNVQ